MEPVGGPTSHGGRIRRGGGSGHGRFVGLDVDEEGKDLAEVGLDRGLISLGWWGRCEGPSERAPLPPTSA